MIKRKYFLTLVLFLVSLHIHAQVVINEVMVYPGGNQGLIFFNGGSGNEYIELYNPGCSSIDVSGYFIGDGQDFAGFISGGGFRIPNVPAAVIPPNGHLVLGTATSSADSNSVDIKLPNYPSNYCLNTAGRNFILANADGWVALYNASGVPVDAIYWASAASKITTNTADFGPFPCVPSGSPNGIVLASAQQIYTSFPGLLKYAGINPTQGKTFSRIPDGGNWQAGINPSINDLTVGNCNGGTCVTATTFQIPALVTQPSCSGSNGAITITPSPSGSYTYTWSPNVSTNQSASNLAAGSYSININSGGCDKDTVITLSSTSGPTAIAYTKTDAGCAQNDGTLTIGSTTGGTGPYTYNFNNGGFSGTLFYNNLASGNYPLIVKDNNGCTFSVSVIIGGGSVVTSQAGPDTTICYGNTVNLYASGGTTYSWSPSAGLSDPGIANPVAFVLSPVTYTVTISAGNCNGTATVSVNIFPQLPTPYITQSGDTLSCSTSPMYTSYQWYSNSTLIPNATNSKYIPTQSGNYNVAVKDDNGCSTSVGINIVLTGLESLSSNNNSLVLFPNPVHSSLEFNSSALNLKERVEVTITDVLGKVIRCEKNRFNDTEKLDVSELSAGIYFIRLADEKQMWVGRFVKE